MNRNQRAPFLRTKPELTMSPEAKKQAIASIKRCFMKETEHEIGDLNASLLLDYFLRKIGPTVYNRAIADARSFFKQRAADLDGVCYRAEFPYWGKSHRAI